MDIGTNKILLSVDMDEWYQARWVTGSDFSLWSDTRTFFKEYYGSEKPAGEILPTTDRILDLFEAHGLTATFFFTGEIASYYPDLVKRISSLGHEIASHNYIHKDYTAENKGEFRTHLVKSKRLLEDLSGEDVVGYRAPNSVIDNFMIEVLLENGFRYDSSVTPTRPIMGKFGKFTKAPVNPYRLAADNFGKAGDSGLWEFPWPVFPFVKLPSGSGVMTRIAGYYYAVISLNYALRSGDTAYYFHPYEIGGRPKVKPTNMKTRVFLRNTGEKYYETLRRILSLYRDRFTHGRELLQKCESTLKVESTGKVLSA